MNSNIYIREKYLKKIRGFYDAFDIIKVITGIRRCGKSTLMQMIITELENNGITSDSIIYINLDKKDNKHIKKANQLENKIDNLITENKNYYLFIDEIQNVENFEEVINSYREEGNISIFITGSNSYLLSGELITKLTGRYLEFEIFPLSFDEYTEMKKQFNKSINSNLLLELNEYIINGGFPRAILFDNYEDKKTYTKGIVNEIFDKDIKKRVKIKDVDSFDIVKKFIINNFGSSVSINSIQKSLSKNGVHITRTTIKKYITTLVDSKVLYECERFDMKSKKILLNEKKYYLADLSIYFSLSTDIRINYGPCLENIIFLYAKSLGYEISVGRIGKLECDFILRNNYMDYSYIQVAYTILENKKTEDREYTPLELIKDNYKKYVMTTDYFLQKRNGIIHANIMDFIINKEKF